MSETGTWDGTTKLVDMSNQISVFFSSYPHEKAVNGIEEHIAKFWDKRMRLAILAHLDKGGAGLEPLVLEALAQLKANSKALN